jgi:hypothetical protein
MKANLSFLALGFAVLIFVTSLAKAAEHKTEGTYQYFYDLNKKNNVVPKVGKKYSLYIMSCDHCQPLLPLEHEFGECRFSGGVAQITKVGHTKYGVKILSNKWIADESDCKPGQHVVITEEHLLSWIRVESKSQPSLLPPPKIEDPHQVD